jgi:asparagine synthase (glutamine-hydrolysing)
MCSIVGIINNIKKPEYDLLQASNSMHSRGPDMSNIKGGNNWNIAFNRLSIHDLSSDAMQPFVYDGVTVYLNGEVFNYLELIDEHKDEFIPNSKSDVEILPFLYTKYGINFLDKLNGMFAMVIIDNIKDVNYLVRDRFGEKPLYYHHTGNDLFFASEVKALKYLVDLEVDTINIKANLSCWFLPEPLTLYKNTFSIYPGSYLEFRGDYINEVRWYKPVIKACLDSKEEISKKFIKLYQSSIDLRLRSDTPIGVFLSGGLDSTSIAKFSNEVIGKNLTSFGADIKYKYEIERNNTDVEIPRKIAKDLGFEYKTTVIDYDYYNKNIVKIVSHYDEIFMNSGALVFYSLSRFALDNGVKVILTGAAGDELFGGYTWQSGLVKKFNFIFSFFQKIVPYRDIFYEQLLYINRKLATAYKIVSDFKVWHAESLSDFSRYLGSDRKIVEDRLRGNANKYFKVSESHAGGDKYNVMNCANIFTTISAQNYYSDIACMKFSVENRAPFLDYRVYEYMMSIPNKLKVKHGQKWLFRYILKGHMPDYVLKTKKSGPTMPVVKWLHNDRIVKKIMAFVSKNIFIVERYFSPIIANRIKNDNNFLFSIGDQQAALRLFAIINLIIWAKFNVLEEDIDEGLTFEEIIKV